MRGRLHIDHDIFAAAHLDRLVIHGERLPGAVAGLVVAFAVELLEVEILRVGIERRDSPSHMLVVPGNRQTASRAASLPRRGSPARADRPCTRCSAPSARGAYRSRAAAFRWRCALPRSPSCSIRARSPRRQAVPALRAPQPDPRAGRTAGASACGLRRHRRRCGRLGMRLAQVENLPVGGWSRHEPTGYRSLSSFGLCSFAAICSRASFTFQCVSSVCTMIMPMQSESAPVHGCGL